LLLLFENNLINYILLLGIFIGNVFAYVYFFSKFLKAKLPPVILVFAGAVVHSAAVLIFVRSNAQPEIAIITFVINTAALILLFEGKLSKKVVLFSVFYLGLGILDGMMAVTMTLMGKPLTYFLSNPYLYYSYNLVVFPALVVLYTKICVKLLRIRDVFMENSVANVYLVFIGVSGFIPHVFLIHTMFGVNYQGLLSLISSVFLLGFVIIQLIMLIRYYRDLTKSITTEKEKEKLLISLRAAMAEKERTDKYTEEVLKIRRDMTDLLDSIISALDSGNTDGAGMLIARNIERQDYLSIPVKTGNLVVDYFCNKTAERSKRCNISFSFECAGAFSGIDNADMCVVVSNILDNAVNACEKVGIDRNIAFRMHENNGIIYVGCENSRVMET